MDKLNKSDEACEKLGIAPSTFWNWIRKEQLPIVRLGGRVMVKQSVIDTILDKGLDAVSQEVHPQQERNVS